VQPLLSTEQTSKILGVTIRTLFTITQRGDLPCIKVGRSVRYDTRDLESYLKQNKSQGKESHNG